MLSWIDENKDESYQEQQEPISPEYPTNHSCEVSFTCNTNRRHLENNQTKKLVQVKGAHYDREPNQFKLLSLA